MDTFPRLPDVSLLNFWCFLPHQIRVGQGESGKGYPCIFVHQVVHHLTALHIGRRCFQTVNKTCSDFRVCVDFHAKVPLIAFFGLMRLRIPLSPSLFRLCWCREYCRSHNLSFDYHQTELAQFGFDAVKYFSTTCIFPANGGILIWSFHQVSRHRPNQYRQTRRSSSYRSSHSPSWNRRDETIVGHSKLATYATAASGDAPSLPWSNEVQLRSTCHARA